MIIQASDDGSWDQAGFEGSAEKWLGSEFMSKVELTWITCEVWKERSLG